MAARRAPRFELEPCPTCGGPVPQGQKFCRRACSELHRELEGKRRRITQLEVLVEDLRARLPPKPVLRGANRFHCLTCGKKKAGRWCSEDHRDEWLRSLRRGERWVQIVAVGIFRMEAG